MKTLTIGNTTFEIIDCEQCRDNKKGFYLRLLVSVESIGMDTFYALLNGNKEDIIYTKEDGIINTYVGFGLIGKFSCEDGVIEAAQYAFSEAEAQLSVAQNKITEQNKSIVDMQGIIIDLNNALNTYANIIAEQASKIAEQTEQMASLTEMSAAQLVAIDGILTNVVPTIIDLAVTEALEAVKETSEEVEIPEEVTGLDPEITEE